MESPKEHLRSLFGKVLEELEVRRSFEGAAQVLEEAKVFLRRDGRNRTSQLRVVAVGKAAIPMAKEAIERLDPREVIGLISAPSKATEPLPGFRIFHGGHPIPNEQSLQAGREALRLMRGATQDDLSVFLISGGGSALMEAPLSVDISLEDLRELHRVLVLSGAGITDINVVRKHFSSVKGGRLAAAASPSRQITIYVSDVPDGHESCVASGPTLPDDSTLDDVDAIMREYKLYEQLPGSVRRLLDTRVLPETPKEDNPVFRQASWYCLLSNANALRAAMDYCERQGWRCLIDTTVDEKPAHEAAQYLIERVLRLKEQYPDQRVSVVAGGEVRVQVTGEGQGGRNQAFVLHCVEAIAGKNIAVLSAGTDGVDGNSDAAGAVADGDSQQRAASFGMSPQQYLRDADSNTFFMKLGDDIVTGDTGTNVRDVRVILHY